MTATNSATPSTSAAAMIIAVWIARRGIGLAGDTRGRLATDLADADAGAHHRETGGETRTDEAVALVGARGGRGLKDGKNDQHVPLLCIDGRSGVGRARRAWIASPGATSPR